MSGCGIFLGHCVESFFLCEFRQVYNSASGALLFGTSQNALISGSYMRFVFRGSGEAGPAARWLSRHCCYGGISHRRGRTEWVDLTDMCCV